MNDEARFWAKVAKSEGCWFWTGAITDRGGEVSCAFRYTGKTGNARRFSYELFNGPVSEGLLVKPACSGVVCVRPDHLKLVAAPAATVEGRFWALVERGPGCWLWKGALHGPPPQDYGIFNAGGRTARAHVFSFRLSGRRLHGRQEVCHACDVPRCVNPDHLFAGTRADNMQDASRKGRMKHRSPRPRGARGRFAHGTTGASTTTLNSQCQGSAS